MNKHNLILKLAGDFRVIALYLFIGFSLTACYAAILFSENQKLFFVCRSFELQYFHNGYLQEVHIKVKAFFAYGIVSIVAIGYIALSIKIMINANSIEVQIKGE